jgi:hypothetical protein
MIYTFGGVSGWALTRSGADNEAGNGNINPFGKDGKNYEI